MSIDLDKLKKLSMRVIIERNSLVETLVAIPATEMLSSGVIPEIGESSAVGAAVLREIAAHEPHMG